MSINNTTTGIYCSSDAYGGLEINTLRLIRWMRVQGWHLSLLTANESSMLRQAIEDGLEAVPGADGSFFFRLRALKKWVKEKKVDNIIIPFRKDLKLLAFYKRFFNPRIRLMYQQHMQLGLPRRDWIHTRRYHMIDAWVSPLPYLKEETLRFTKVKEEKIDVIPFGIEPALLIDTPIKTEAARAAFGLPEGKIIIGALGRIDRQKGQDMLVSALHLLRTRHGVDAHLLLVGDATLNEGDDYSRSIAGLIREHNLDDVVHLRSYQKDIAPFFRAIDVFALPSHNETYGMVTLEAMAAGVPVIGTHAGGTTEILEGGKLGYLFTPKDAEDFIRAFISMSKDDGLGEKLEAARAAVLQRYSAEGMVRRYQLLLQRVNT